MRDESGLGSDPASSFASKRFLTSIAASFWLEFCLRQDWLEQSGGDLVLSQVDGHGFGARKLGRSISRAASAKVVTLKEIDGTRRPMLVNDAESPLGWLKSRKSRSGRPLISDAQYEAGGRLRADYWFANLNPRVTANWSAPAPSGRSRRGAPLDAASMRDEVIAAKERVMRALDAVGPELSQVLVDVCCELKGLEEAQRSHDWPQRAGKVVLRLGLTRLARHYGLDVPSDLPQRRKGIRHWGSADYRPTLDSWRGSGDQ